MVTVDNAVIAGLTANEIITREFPFLSRSRLKLPTVKSGGCCGKRNTTVDYNGVKIALANMPDSAKTKFKLLTGWNQVRVIYETSAGTVTSIF